MSKITKKNFDINNCEKWTLKELKEFAEKIGASRKSGTKEQICESIEKVLSKEENEEDQNKTD